MTEKKNQEESKKSAFSQFPYNEECFEKISEFALIQLGEGILKSLENVKATPRRMENLLSNSTDTCRLS